MGDFALPCPMPQIKTFHGTFGCRHTVLCKSYSVVRLCGSYTLGNSVHIIAHTDRFYTLCAELMKFAKFHVDVTVLPVNSACLSCIVWMVVRESLSVHCVISLLLVFSQQGSFSHSLHCSDNVLALDANHSNNTIVLYPLPVSSCCTPLQNCVRVLVRIQVSC